MPDITMCNGVCTDLDSTFFCPFRENCYRYKVPPNKRRQSYFVQPPIVRLSTNGDYQCDFFVDNNL